MAVCIYAWLFWGQGIRNAAESYLNYAQQALTHQISSENCQKIIWNFDIAGRNT